MKPPRDPRRVFLKQTSAGLVKERFSPRLNPSPGSEVTPRRARLPPRERRPALLEPERAAEGVPLKRSEAARRRGLSDGGGERRWQQVAAGNRAGFSEAARRKKIAK